jgi:hypothetical protein
LQLLPLAIAWHTAMRGITKVELKREHVKQLNNYLYKGSEDTYYRNVISISSILSSWLI